MSEPAHTDASPTVVLMHGAFADGSGCNGVIERVQAKGVKVTAPANALGGISSDSAWSRPRLRLFDGPVITVPTITIGSDFDGANAGGHAYAQMFSGPYSHRVLDGIGHNVPQEAPEAFADAILEVGGAT